MISAVDVESRILAALDADTTNNGRYTWDHGIREAVNNAIDFVTLTYNSAFAQKKIAEESLRDLIKEDFSTTTSSRIDLINLNYWTIISFHPVGSVREGNILGSKTTFRLTSEEASNTTRNCFVPGTAFLTGELLDYAHEYVADHEVRFYPALTDGTVVGVRYLVDPSYMSEDTAALESAIQFPQQVMNILTEKSLEFLGRKEAGEEATYTISEKEVSKLLSVL